MLAKGECGAPELDWEETAQATLWKTYASGPGGTATRTDGLS